MNPNRVPLLRELEQFAAENDARVAERREKMLNITPDTGAFLAVLVKAMKARRLLEVGTSNGYSTLWLADAVELAGGRVTTVELLPAKADLAQRNFARAGLAAAIDLHVGDAGDHLRRQGPASFEFVFLDSDRRQYPAWWPDLRRVLAPGGLLVADNAVSHASEMEGFLQLVTSTPGYSAVVVPVGKGELLVLKEAQG